MTKEVLIEELVRDRYLKTSRIIEAFKAVDRADFVSDEHKNQAYVNYPLAIGYGQTISQPLTVAFMLELLEPKKGEKILEIGAGSGWQAALLGYIVGVPPAGGEGKVITIERIPELKAFAEKNISKFPFAEYIKVIEGDGSKGYEAEAPYDKIIAAAAGEKIPEVWKEQLKIGGRIVAPVKDSIVVLEKVSKEEFTERHFFGFSFVPLVEEK